MATIPSPVMTPMADTDNCMYSLNHREWENTHNAMISGHRMPNRIIQMRGASAGANAQSSRPKIATSPNATGKTRCMWGSESSKYRSRNSRSTSGGKRRVMGSAVTERALAIFKSWVTKCWQPSGPICCSEQASGSCLPRRKCSMIPTFREFTHALFCETGGLNGGFGSRFSTLREAAIGRCSCQNGMPGRRRREPCCGRP